jgi:uncharacterized protein YhfF
MEPDLPLAEFAFPGPVRDALVAAILTGDKTSTTGLVADFEKCGDPLPEVGRRAAVVDSDGRPVAVIETTHATVARLGDVDLAHALAEGEGFRTLEEWRAVHEQFWHSDQMRAVLEDPGFVVDDDTPVVLERFRLVRVLPAGGEHPSA